MTASPVRYELDGSVATVTLDDGKANVLTETTLNALRAAFDQADGVLNQVEQRHAERQLEPLELHRNRRLCQVELQGGARHPTVLADCEEGPQRRHVQVARHYQGR
jgi:hypothetical protein